MALRIHEYVIRGEIDNTLPNTTHGWLELAGAEGPIILDLTGDCADDIRGKRIRFTADPAPDPAVGAGFESLQLAPQQIGPTGIMTAAGYVKTFECSVEEFCRRSKLGEPPPTTWKRRLYLNWFSQNFEVTLELAGPLVEWLDGGEWVPLPNPGPTPEEIEAARQAADLPPSTGLDITIVSADGTTRRLQFPGDEDALPPEIPRLILDAEPEPGRELQDMFDAQAEAIERAIRGEADDDEDDEDGEEEKSEDELLFEMEMIDNMITSDAGDLLINLFEEPHHFPDPERLSDAQAEFVLMDLLRQLALCGIALHVCPHYTPREAYRYLLEEIFPEVRVFKPLMDSGWVQHFMTSEACPQCEAEIAGEFEKEADKGEEPPF